MVSSSFKAQIKPHLLRKFFPNYPCINARPPLPCPSPALMHFTLLFSSRYLPCLFVYVLLASTPPTPPWNISSVQADICLSPLHLQDLAQNWPQNSHFIISVKWKNPLQDGKQCYSWNEWPLQPLLCAQVDSLPVAFALNAKHSDVQ